MMSETYAPTVTITVDEYFDLRQKAEANAYLVRELGSLEQRCNDLDRRLWEIERKMNNIAVSSNHQQAKNIEKLLEQKHGQWLPTNDDNKKRCSRCDVIHLIAQYPHGQINYCPNCGAKMDEECK